MKEPKKLSEMTKEEIRAIPDWLWKNWDPFDKKACDSCLHLTKALSLWCNNHEAISKRGTRLPGVHSCPYWAPNSSLQKVPPANANKQTGATKLENKEHNINKWKRIKDYINKHK